MTEYAYELIDRMLNAPPEFLYAFLYLSAVIENLFPPIPGDTITALGAFLVGTGRLNYTPVYILTTLGSVTGFMMLYFLGRLLGRKFFIKHDISFFSKKSIVKAEQWFRRRGHLIVLINRFLPGVRSAISLVSGMSFLPPLRMFLYSLASAAVWNLIWIQVGYTLGNNWSVVRDKIELIIARYNLAAGAFMALALLVFIGWRIYFGKTRGNGRSAPS